MSNTPKIRFAGFTENWEQHKLGDLGSVAMCRRIFKEQTTEVGEIPFYKIGTFGNHADAYISRELFEEYKSKYPYPLKGDILVSASGSIGRTVEYTGKDEYFQDSNIVWLMHDERLENSFLKYFYQVVKWSGLEGSTIKRLYNSNILRTKIMLPSSNDSDEQKLIGALMATLDKLIDHHQHKHEKLISLRSACLDKMFPKSGNKTPEVRFAGFEGEWEWQKLSHYADFHSGNGLSWTDISENGEQECILYGNLYTEYGMITDKVVFRTNRVLENPVYSEFGDVLIPASDTTPTGLARATSIEKAGVLLGGDINIVRHKRGINGSCLSLAINANKKELIKLIKGTTVRHIHNNEIKNIEISMPKDEAEQESIALFFKRIDVLVNLQQCKIEKLKQLKHSMLHNMFV